MFSGTPVGKGGVGTGDKLVPVPLRYNEQIVFSNAGYHFGFGADNRDHCVCVIPITKPTGPDNLLSSFTITEGPAGQYTLNTTVGRFFDAVQAKINNVLGSAPATSIFKQSGGVEYLRIESTMFPNEATYYIVGVCANLNAPSGPLSVGKLIDWKLVFVNKLALSIFDAAAGGVDTTTLDIALALAGHNVKLRDAAFIDGLPATRTIQRFSRALDAVSTPSLEIVSSDEGIASPALTVTSTPDGFKNIRQDVTKE